jgi:hypothetical protein
MKGTDSMKPERSATTSTASATLSTMVSFVLVDLVVIVDGSLADGDESEISGVLVVGKGFLEEGADTGWAGPVAGIGAGTACKSAEGGSTGVDGREDVFFPPTIPLKPTLRRWRKGMVGDEW